VEGGDLKRKIKNTAEVVGQKIKSAKSERLFKQ